jgi:hypothetical protein
LNERISTPVFVGTRVPLQNLIDALEGGESIEGFLEGFPSVKRSQAITPPFAAHGSDTGPGLTVML